MPTDKIRRFNFTFTTRSAPARGPVDSDSWNDSVTEISTDLSNLSIEWNQKLVPLSAGLPDGETDTTINAFKFGLDGANMWVDQNADASVDSRFYNSIDIRPNTVLEQFDTLYTYVDDQIDLTRTELIDSTGGLTVEQKNRIGANIFDTSQTSSSTSLDGKSENNRLNLVQVANDLYGDVFSLDNDGLKNLTNADLREMVTALLQLHNSDWNTGDPVTHTGAFTATQSGVDSSAPGNDSFVGSPINLKEDLDQIRTRIKTLKGTIGWQTTLTELYSGGANSLEELFVSTAGTGTKTATNPWGYHYSNIDSLVTVLNAVRDYTGQDTVTDASPDYTSNNFILNGDSLETAIGKLDAAVASGAGVGTYLELDGTSVMAGNLNMGAQDIILAENIGAQTDILASGNVLSSGDMRSEGNIEAGGDIELTASGNGVVMHSPDGTRWRLQIDNTGAIITTAI